MTFCNPVPFSYVPRAYSNSLKTDIFKDGKLLGILRENILWADKEKAKLIIAGYIENKMVSVNLVTLDEIATGKNDISIPLEDSIGATKVRAFLWSGEITPVVDFGEYPKN